jgi:hypothetical protein
VVPNPWTAVACDSITLAVLLGCAAAHWCVAVLLRSCVTYHPAAASSQFAARIPQFLKSWLSLPCSPFLAAQHHATQNGTYRCTQSICLQWRWCFLSSFRCVYPCHLTQQHFYLRPHAIGPNYLSASIHHLVADHQQSGCPSVCRAVAAHTSGVRRPVAGLTSATILRYDQGPGGGFSCFSTEYPYCSVFLIASSFYRGEGGGSCICRVTLHAQYCQHAAAASVLACWAFLFSAYVHKVSSQGLCLKLTRCHAAPAIVPLFGGGFWDLCLHGRVFISQDTD